MTGIVLRLLGDPLVRVHDLDGTSRTVTPQPGRVTALLAILALNAGRVVTTDRLVEELWGAAPPDTARATVHVNVSRLRRQLRGSVLAIHTRSPGYLLEAPGDAIDLHELGRLARDARAAASGDAWDETVRLTGEALRLWHGDPFPGLQVALLEQERQHLVTLRHEAVDLRCRGLLALGRAADALEPARWLCRADPYAEAGVWACMRALHETGRTPAALEVFDSYRQLLADDLGLDPGARVAALQLELLRAGSDAASTPPAAPGGADRGVPAPAVVGRQRETGVIDDVLSEATDNRPAVVLIEGEAGIGKTTLARHATARARELGLQVVWARGVDGMAMPPLSMWRRVLGQLGGADVVPASAPGPEDTFTLYDGLVDTLFEVVPQGGLLVVLDDLQWADDGTLQVLQLMANRMWSEPLVVLATRRPAVVAPTALGATALERIDREAVTRRLRLAPWSADDLASLVEEPEQREELVRRSGGNPLLVRELLQADRQAAPDGDGAVPESVRSIVDARAASLPPTARDLLEVAAVAGRVLDLPVLGSALGLSAEGVIDALEPLAVQGLLHTGRSGEWAFPHDLHREALVDLLSPRRRSALHALLADALERLHADDPESVVADLAHHRFEAALGQPSPAAFEACSRAADAAAAALAYDRAARHRTRALTSLPRTPDHRTARLECLMALVRERRCVGDVVGASAALDEARRLANTLGDDRLEREVVALLGEPTLWNWRQLDEVDPVSVASLDRLLPGADVPAQRAALLGTLGVELYYGADRARGLRAAREGVALAREVGEVSLLARTLNNLTIATWVPDDADERRAAIEETLRLRPALAPVNEALALLHRSPLLLREGRVVAARADLASAEWLVPRLGRPEIEGQLASQLAGIAMAEGEDDWAEEGIERAHTLLSRTSLWGARWVRQVQRVTLARSRDDLESCLDELLGTAAEEAFRVLRWTAVLALVETGQDRQARSMQRRWGLTTLPQPYWNSDFDDAQAAMTALRSGLPDLRSCYDRLLPRQGTLVVAGTGLASWGPVDDVLADLARALGREEDALRHRRAAETLRDAVRAELAGQEGMAG